MYVDSAIYAPRRASKPTGSPAFAAMVIALAFLAGEPFRVCFCRLLGRPKKSAVEQAAGALSLDSLRSSILGRHQDLITNLFGQPQTQMQSKCPIWYYPLDAQLGVAMAITFHDGRAVLVEFFQFP